MTKQQKLLQEPDNHKPFVSFNSDGILIFSGMSCMENTVSFFKPLFDWVEEYIKNPAPKTVFLMHHLYFEDISQNYLVGLLVKLKDLPNINFVWYYEANDTDAIDFIEDFEASKGINLFQTIEIDPKQESTEIFFEAAALSILNGENPPTFISGTNKIDTLSAIKEILQIDDPEKGFETNFVYTPELTTMLIKGPVPPDEFHPIIKEWFKNFPLSSRKSQKNVLIFYFKDIKDIQKPKIEEYVDSLVNMFWEIKDTFEIIWISEMDDATSFGLFTKVSQSSVFQWKSALLKVTRVVEALNDKKLTEIINE